MGDPEIYFGYSIRKTFELYCQAMKYEGFSGTLIMKLFGEKFKYDKKK